MILPLLCYKLFIACASAWWSKRKIAKASQTKIRREKQRIYIKMNRYSNRTLFHHLSRWQRFFSWDCIVSLINCSYEKREESLCPLLNVVNKKKLSSAHVAKLLLKLQNIFLLSSKNMKFYSFNYFLYIVKIR